jgi:hypothetical protein
MSFDECRIKMILMKFIWKNFTFFETIESNLWNYERIEFGESFIIQIMKELYFYSQEERKIKKSTQRNGGKKAKFWFNDE